MIDQRFIIGTVIPGLKSPHLYIGIQCVGHKKVCNRFLQKHKYKRKHSLHQVLPGLGRHRRARGGVQIRPGLHRRPGLDHAPRDGGPPPGLPALMHVQQADQRGVQQRHLGAHLQGIHDLRSVSGDHFGFVVKWMREQRSSSYR